MLPLTDPTSQRDRRNKEEYRDLATAIVDIVVAMQDELQADEQHEGSRFWSLCLDFNKYVVPLLDPGGS